MTTRTDAPVIDLAAIKALFQESLEEQMKPLREAVDVLQAKVADQDRMIPKFVPMANRANPSGMPRTPADHLAQMAGMKPGDTHSAGIKSIPVTQNGKRLDQGELAALLQNYRAQFQPGDAIRINPEAERLGWAEGKTWAALLAKSRENPDGLGTVREVAPFSHRGWMYRVHVPGHTSSDRGMIFDQHELLHA